MWEGDLDKDFVICYLKFQEAKEKEPGVSKERDADS